MQLDTKRSPPFLPSHAFVVQIHADTQVEAGQLTGRVEHLVSRQAVAFQSLEALLAFMARILRELRSA
jgi:hypothetical protein